jgi:hypothetical protein
MYVMPVRHTLHVMYVLHVIHVCRGYGGGHIGGVCLVYRVGGTVVWLCYSTI